MVVRALPNVWAAIAKVASTMVDQIALSGGNEDSPESKDLRREALDLCAAVRNLEQVASPRRKAIDLVRDDYHGSMVLVNLAIVHNGLTDSMVRTLRTTAQRYVHTMEL